MYVLFFFFFVVGQYSVACSIWMLFTQMCEYGIRIQEVVVPGRILFLLWGGAVRRIYAIGEMMEGWNRPRLDEAHTHTTHLMEKMVSLAVLCECVWVRDCDACLTLGLKNTYITYITYKLSEAIRSGKCFTKKGVYRELLHSFPRPSFVLAIVAFTTFNTSLNLSPHKPY